MTVLAELVRLYERLLREGEAPLPGYSVEKIGGEVVLDAAGNVLAINDLRVPDEKGRLQPRVMPVPAAFKRTSGIKANRLWDKTSYLLGVTAAEGEGGTLLPVVDDKTRKENDAFADAHETLLAGTDDAGLRAVLGFVRSWRPEMFADRGFDPALLNLNLVFRLNDDEVDGQPRFVHQRPAAEKLFQESMETTEARCLVTGEEAPVARLHPSIKGVQGAQSSGASLVSFNLDAFTSYGKSQGANAPVSEKAAFAYGAALNALLARGSGRNLRIGDATVVFWARTPEREKASLAERLLGQVLDPPDEKAETNKLGELLKDIAAGRASGRPEFAPDTRIFILGLAPNAARIAIRFWRPGTLGDFARNVLRFWEDLRQEPSAWKGAPAAWSLLCEVAVQNKTENIPPRLGGDLMQAVLTGGLYPHTLLAAVIARIRADQNINGRRVAIIAAVLRRNFKEVIPMSLDRNNSDPAYLLGRLFAAYAYAEHSNTKRSATLRDKYLAGASASPAGIFPLLMRGYENNRSSLLKAQDQRKGYGIKADKAVSEILEHLDGGADLPKSLNLEGQGRFFIGFYHQWNAFFEKPEEAAEAAAESNDSTEPEGAAQ